MITSQDDLKKFMFNYVYGLCAQANAVEKIFVSMDLEFSHFVHHTFNVCWKYTFGETTLDGRCSDRECIWAGEVCKIFEPHALAVLERELEVARGYDNDERVSMLEAKITRIKNHR